MGITRRGFLSTCGLAAVGTMAPIKLTAASAQEASGNGEVAPLPPTALGPPIPNPPGYRVEEIGAGLHLVTEGTYQALFQVTDEGVILVDAPPTLEAAIPAAIAEVTPKPVTHVILSHSHGDHIGVAGRLFGNGNGGDDGVTFIGHEETAGILARANDPRRPVPNRTFEHKTTVGDDDWALELIYPGPNHEPGNIIVWAPHARTLMLVDVIVPGWVPFKNLSLAEDVQGYIDVHDTVLGYPFETFVGGHLTRVGTREDVQIAREYVHDIQAASANALATVDFFAVAARTGFANQWHLFDEYLDEVAQTAAAQVEAEWVGQLGGADIFTEDHCFTMAESLRIDFNGVAG